VQIQAATAGLCLSNGNGAVPVCCFTVKPRQRFDFQSIWQAVFEVPTLILDLEIVVEAGVVMLLVEESTVLPLRIIAK